MVVNSKQNFRHRIQVLQTRKEVDSTTVPDDLDDQILVTLTWFDELAECISLHAENRSLTIVIMETEASVTIVKFKMKNMATSPFAREYQLAGRHVKTKRDMK